jgi:hypothetical protein
LSELTPAERGIDAAPVNPVTQNPVQYFAPAPVAAPVKRSTWKTHLVSITERSVSTFLFSFLGLVTATNLSDPTALKAAGIAGGLSVAAYLRNVAGTYVASTPDAG